MDRPVFATDFLLRAKNASGVPLAGCATGVGHPEKTLADVRAAEARSRDTDRPDGVIQSFQVT